MFIDFPAIVSQWVALDSLASSLRNDALSDPQSIAKPVAGVNRIFKGTARFCQVKCVENNRLGDHWGFLC